MLFKEIKTSDQFKSVERSDMIAWRDSLTKQKISIRTINKKNVRRIEVFAKNNA